MQINLFSRQLHHALGSRMEVTLRLPPNAIFLGHQLGAQVYASSSSNAPDLPIKITPPPRTSKTYYHKGL